MSVEKPIYPKKRNLDKAYMLVRREKQFERFCFTDLTVDEQNDYLADYDQESLKRMCLYLAEQLRAIGNQLDLYGE